MKSPTNLSSNPFWTSWYETYSSESQKSADMLSFSCGEYSRNLNLRIDSASFPSRTALSDLFEIPDIVLQTANIRFPKRRPLRSPSKLKSKDSPDLASCGNSTSCFR